MPKRSGKKRHEPKRDPNEIAKAIVDQVAESATQESSKSPATVQLDSAGRAV